MQLLVVPGGLGTRLRPVTLTRPKALVPLLNRPQILHLIDRLPDRIDQVLVAVNYMFDEVRDFFGSRDVGRDVVVVHETTPLGTGGAIKNVEDRLPGTLFAVTRGGERGRDRPPGPGGSRRVSRGPRDRGDARRRARR